MVAARLLSSGETLRAICMRRAWGLGIDDHLLRARAAEMAGVVVGLRGGRHGFGDSDPIANSRDPLTGCCRPCGKIVGSGRKNG